MPYERLPDGTLEPLRRTPGEVVDLIKERGVKFVELQLTDLRGRLHYATVSPDSVDLDAFEYGVPKLDGSSIEGFVEIQESDMVLKPDPNTFGIFPWDPRRARLICDVYWHYGRGRLSRDPRYVAERAEEYLKSLGYDGYWGAEIEFFVFDKVFMDVASPYSASYRIVSKETEVGSTGKEYPIKPKRGYGKATPQDTLADYRSECSRALEEGFGVICTFHGHEVATAGQVEINIRHDSLKYAADSVMTYKLVAKTIARQHGLVATMMPKPVFGDNASGMHVHISLWRDGKNLFYDPDDEYAEFSQLGRYFAGGIFEHAYSLCAIIAPTTNSYKRLVPGYEAPVCLTWGRANRSVMIRIPVYHKGRKAEATKRIEFRTPDPACNPYLCLAAISAAGIDGIKKKIDIGDPIDKDVYKLTEEERRKLGIQQLPTSLKGAIEALEADREYLKPIFTDDVIDKVIEFGLKDHFEVSIRPHPYEFYLYFDV